jgi:lysozyme
MANISEARQGAFLNMAFNLGIAGLAGFTNTLMHAKYGNWEQVAKNLLASKYATQVGDRAKRLAKQFETGEWQ